VDRAPGLSVRLKLTLSYAGFLMLAGALLLGAAWLAGRHRQSFGFLDGAISTTGGLVPGNSNFLLRAYAPAAAVVLAFLLVFGLVGGWLLAGRMLAPLTRITDATRIAANGSLSHRIELEGRQDEFRELADSFDAMVARLEAHIAEQKRFAANASHELRPRWRSRRPFSTSPATIRTATPASSTNASASSTRERSTSPRHCSC
jgi:two-component system sensor histidine kinase VanS